MGAAVVGVGGAHLPCVGGADILHRRALADPQDLPRLGYGKAICARRPCRGPRLRLGFAFTARAQQQGAGDGQQRGRLGPCHAHRQEGGGDEAADGHEAGAGPPVAPLQAAPLAAAPDHVAEHHESDQEQDHAAPWAVPRPGASRQIAPAATF